MDEDDVQTIAKMMMMMAMMMIEEVVSVRANKASVTV